MKISKIKTNNSEGFTLIELVVVIAGLAALGAFSIPNFLNLSRLNKIEETKAIMNGYASDCLSKYRASTDPVDFIENATPDQLDNEKLITLGYVIDGDKNKCSHLAVKPQNVNEENLFAFDFRISSEGLILKTAAPSNNPRFLNSCKGWAGSNCGLSEAQKAEFERLAALAKAKSECLSKYSKWLSDGGSGENVSWDIDNETCTKPVFAFEGIPVNSLEAVEQALKAKYGKACADWRLSKKNSNFTNSNPQTKDPECGGVDYWFHSGTEFTTQAAWTEYDNLLKEQACIKDRSDALSRGEQGKYTYGPTPGPDPCGKVVWLCKGEEYGSEGGFLTSSCAPKVGGGGGNGGTPPPPPPVCTDGGINYLCDLGTFPEFCKMLEGCPGR
ncbi:MAG: hypothetical protein JJ843_00880 [Prochlorococcus marinus CUG1434]|nr:hypothetical protein [Prochlorococcus marinus CUG1434]